LNSLWEITWLGRGGQGAVTASNALAKAAYLDGYNDVQAFPFFGAERRGAPVKAFTRISKDKIYDNSQIYTSDVLVVLEYVLLENIDLKKEIKKNGFLIINTSKNNFENDLKNFNIFTVNATKIALDSELTLAGFPIVNTPMLGAFAKSTKLITFNSVISVIRDMWPEKFLEKNVNAAKLAYEQTVEVK
jgi:2-oxoacid:acceptor oxidoreductase gamma subunit (pyruvate/2-ketoisovalerate family)